MTVELRAHHMDKTHMPLGTPKGTIWGTSREHDENKGK
jgi:hypothetical protein